MSEPKPTYKELEARLAEAEAEIVTLRESGRKFRAIFDQMYQFIGLMTPDGTLIEASRSALDFAGIEESDVLGKPFWETAWWTHSVELQERLRNAIRQAATGELVRFEACHPALDGSLHYVDISLKPVKDEAGNICLLIPEGRDVTDRRRVEEELLANQRELAEIFDHGPLPMILVDGERRVQKVNRTAAEASVRTTDEMLGLRSGEALRCLHVLDDPKGCGFGPACETCQIRCLVTETLETGKSHYRVEATYDFAHGEQREQRHVLLSSTRLDRTKDDLVLVCLEDITERKQAEETVRTSQRFLEIANRHMTMPSLLEEFATDLRKLTGCSAIGIRLLDDEGNIPYQAHEGFSREFYELESPLKIQSDQCMCINVVRGQADPKLPFYTEGGSFYMNGATRFLATASEEEKGQTRNACNAFGYESVALVPIRMGQRVLGLIHVADARENTVPLELMQRLEGIAAQLGPALERVQAEETLRTTGVIR